MTETLKALHAHLASTLPPDDGSLLTPRPDWPQALVTPDMLVEIALQTPIVPKAAFMNKRSLVVVFREVAAYRQGIPGTLHVAGRKYAEPTVATQVALRYARKS